MNLETNCGGCVGINSLYGKISFSSGKRTNLSYFYQLYDILVGYVGLFIGYSIPQAPSYLLNLAAWIIAVKNRTRTPNIESNVTEE